MRLEGCGGEARRFECELVTALDSSLLFKRSGRGVLTMLTASDSGCEEISSTHSFSDAEDAEIPTCRARLGHR